MGDDGRRMVNPLTLAQQIKHFPYKYLLKNEPTARYVLGGMICAGILFHFLAKASQAPSNVRNYELYLKKQKEEHEHHKHKLEKYYGEH